MKTEAAEPCDRWFIGIMDIDGGSAGGLKKTDTENDHDQKGARRESLRGCTDLKLFTFLEMNWRVGTRLHPCYIFGASTLISTRVGRRFSDLLSWSKMKASGVVRTTIPVVCSVLYAKIQCIYKSCRRMSNDFRGPSKAGLHVSGNVSIEIGANAFRTMPNWSSPQATQCNLHTTILKMYQEMQLPTTFLAALLLPPRMDSQDPLIYLASSSSLSARVGILPNPITIAGERGGYSAALHRHLLNNLFCTSLRLV